LHGLKDTLKIGSNRPGLLSSACRERFGRFSRRMLLALAGNAATHLGYAAA
jgi:hypothetical protein